MRLAVLALALILLPFASTSPPAAAAATQHARLLRNGFLRLPAALQRAEALALGHSVIAAVAAEAATCAGCPPSSLQDLTDARCFGCDAPSSPSPQRQSFTRARRIVEHDAELAALVQSPALARLAAAAMNVSVLRLYQATAFVKRKGDLPSAWHQDSAAAPFHTDRVATLWLALADVPAGCGALKFVRGSHLPGVPLPSLRDLPLLERLGAMRMWSDADVERLTKLDVVEPPAAGMQAGDATLHLGWALHGAGANECEHDRPALAITYFADGARVHRDLLRIVEGDTPEAESRAIRISLADGSSTLLVRLLSDDAGTWMRWLQRKVPPLLVPGGLVADSELTPVVYNASAAAVPFLALEVDALGALSA